MNQLPLFVRQFIFDFATTAAPALLGFNYVGDPGSILHAVLFGLGAAATAAAVKNLPGFESFLAAWLGLNQAA